ncbi:MAG: thiosulfate oxidation carrier protein SoxY [Gemmatimonadales bacterium]|nr:thiosulfate oxidation carrier protein SoxY [Gemmatimonadales bacterium]
MPDSSMALPIGRRALVRAAAVAMASAPLLRIERLAAGEPDPEIPNEIVAQLIRARIGDRKPVRGKVTLDMPAAAEDGRIVPVIIEGLELPMTPAQHVKSVYLIVDHNPDPLVGAFHLSPQLGRLEIQTRIKMKRLSWVRCLAEMNTGEVWADYARVSVSLNGCG